MFRCSECGCEYSQKPDFCECGNDIFEEIIVENKSEKRNKFTSLDKLAVLSWLIFIFCIALSVIVLLFFPKIDTIQSPNTTVKQTKTTKFIPDINTFWIDYKPQEPIIENIEPENVVLPKKVDIVPKKQTPLPVKTQQAPTAKQQPKPAAKKTTTPTVGKSQTTTYSYEVIQYRTALRQRLFSNLNLYKIEGSGTCGITFAVDENGKLINRNFTFQSDNKTVNDEVYNMLMRTPKFTPPPESYANKQVKMIFKLSSDSYEIKFVN